MERAKRNVHVSVVVEENSCEYLSTNFLHQIMFFFFFQGGGYSDLPKLWDTATA
jgi:queuine/archaeosine tRNA-ribosyltransferase